MCECVLTAMAMAMDDSVTVSMGDEMSGVFRVIFLVNADVRSLKRKGCSVKRTTPLDLKTMIKHSQQSQSNIEF